MPGIAVAVVHQSRQVFACACTDLAAGLDFTVDAACHWFSIKIATVTAAMQLVDAGRLDLDSPVHEYIPGALLHVRRVRVVHLANHSAGLPNRCLGGSTCGATAATSAFLARHRPRKPRFSPVLELGTAT